MDQFFELSQINEAVTVGIPLFDFLDDFLDLVGPVLVPESQDELDKAML